MKSKLLAVAFCFLFAACRSMGNNPQTNASTPSESATLINDGLPKLSEPYTGPLELVASDAPHGLCEIESPFSLPAEIILGISILPNHRCDDINSALEVLEIGDQLYVAQRNARGFRLVNVNDPAHPFEVGAWKFEPLVGKGHISSFHQNDHTYLAVPLESPSPYVDRPCGIAIIEVTQPDELVLLGRYDGNTIGSSVSWCNVHDAQVDTDAEGNAIYMLITTPNTAVLRVLDVQDLNNISELNYYHSRLHPHGEYGSWAHLFTIIDDRVYVALWGGGVTILDKQKLLSGGAPEESALTQPDSIDPQDFVAHDAIPTPDGDFLFVNDMGGIKDGIRLFDIRDLSRPREIWRSSINTSTGQHTLQIWGDLLFVPWFREGLRVFRFDLEDPDHPIIEQVAFQAVREPLYASSDGGVGALRVHSCQVEGAAKTCIYASDEELGLIILALEDT